jgi:hypothetical protein
MCSSTTATTTTTSSSSSSIFHRLQLPLPNDNTIF